MGRKIWFYLLILLLGALGLLFWPKEHRHTPKAIIPEQSVQEEIPTETTDFSLPYEPENWDLRVEKLICYDGPYIEDGTNAPVSGVAGAVLHNAGDRGISCRAGEQDNLFYGDLAAAGGAGAGAGHAAWGV